MRTAYFDCYSGVSGDMVLGALVDCGISLDALRQGLGRLPLSGYRLEAREVKRAGLRGMKVDVILAEASQPEERTLAEIGHIIEGSLLSERVKQSSKEVFHRLTRAEASVHGSSIDEAHLHEVGAVDAMVDVVGAMIGLEMLGVDEFYASPIAVGSGTTKAGHGVLPVPAPATLELLEGVPTVAGPVEAELATPTGVAILRTLVTAFGVMPAGTIEKVGYGAGTSDFEHSPNLLRLMLMQPRDSARGDSLWMLETNLDDVSPEIVAYVSEKLLALGATDVFTQPIQMKKGRAGTLLNVLSDDAHRRKLEDALFAETTTFGVRSYRVERVRLDREVTEVETEFGRVRVKLGRRDGRVVSQSPEYEDCRRLAEKHQVPLKEVYRQAALGLQKGGKVSSQPRSG